MSRQKTIKACWFAYGSCNTKASAEEFCRSQGDGYTEYYNDKGVNPKDRPSQTISITNGKIHSSKNTGNAPFSYKIVNSNGRLVAFSYIRCRNPQSIANNKPKKDRSAANQPDRSKSPSWCTNSPDGLPTINRDSLQRVDFSSACQEHDICFWSIGSVKTQCDSKFLENLKQICSQMSGSKRKQCNGYAVVYYAAVFDSSPFKKRSNQGFQAAQNEAKKLLTDYKKSILT